MNVSASLSALRAYALRQQTAAHNVANVSTPGYGPYRVELEDIEDFGGVRGNVARRGKDGSGIEKGEPQAPGPNQWHSGEPNEALRRPGRTDLAVEFTSMIENEIAYSANAAVIRTSQQMSGEVLNLLA